MQRDKDYYLQAATTGNAAGAKQIQTDYTTFQNTEQATFTATYNILAAMIQDEVTKANADEIKFSTILANIFNPFMTEYASLLNFANLKSDISQVNAMMGQQVALLQSNTTAVLAKLKAAIAGSSATSSVTAQVNALSTAVGKNGALYPCYTANIGALQKAATGGFMTLVMAAMVEGGKVEAANAAVDVYMESTVIPLLMSFMTTAMGCVQVQATAQTCFNTAVSLIQV